MISAALPLMDGSAACTTYMPDQAASPQSLVGSSLNSWIPYPAAHYQDDFGFYPTPIIKYKSFQSPIPMLTDETSFLPVDSPVEEEEKEENAVVSVSTAFQPGAHALEPDIVLSTSDNVLFYVHSQVLKGPSPNAFRAVLDKTSKPKERKRDDNTEPQLRSRSRRYHHINGRATGDDVIEVPDTSAVLNVVLHMVYGTSSAQHSPSLDVLLAAVERMPDYDLEPKKHILPRTPLYDLLLSHAPLFPMHVYTLAAQFEMEDMAVAASSHLLAYPLLSLSEDAVQRMGPIYLKRLMCLHLERFDALKRILLHPPHPHPPTKECTFADQKKLTRAWALVSAYLAWDARVDLSTHTICSVLNPLTEHLGCQMCHVGLQNRIKDVIVQWANVRHTI